MRPLRIAVIDRGLARGDSYFIKKLSVGHTTHKLTARTWRVFWVALYVHTCGRRVFIFRDAPAPELIFDSVSVL
jgi:hypothetical protein